MTTIYRHFKRKDDILSAPFDEGMGVTAGSDRAQASVRSRSTRAIDPG